ncbi:MAG: hypothetical protein E6J63_11145 [Deltaproteobacteria bacterium]|nr:MAG: hypothetical protein E6J63_11145 [Deltaproteobacteria bacterium]
MEALMQRAAHLLQEMTTPRPRLLEHWRAARRELANAEAALVAFARSCAGKIGAFDLTSAHDAWEQLRALRGDRASAQMQMIATARALFAARPFQLTERR